MWTTAFRSLAAERRRRECPLEGRGAILRGRRLVRAGAEWNRRESGGCRREDLVRGHIHHESAAALDGGAHLWFTSTRMGTKVLPKRVSCLGEGDILCTTSGGWRARSPSQRASPKAETPSSLRATAAVDGSSTAGVVCARLLGRPPSTQSMGTEEKPSPCRRLASSVGQARKRRRFRQRLEQSASPWPGSKRFEEPA